MAKEKEPDIPEDIPSWLMTFSDVITLLMTFFILLLTFATSEPETFDRMQVSLFGGGGASGVAGKSDSAMDKDALLLRERPRSGRITMRGSEMPPINSDPVYETLAKGIAGLENEEQRELSTQHSVTLPLTLMVDSSGEISALGSQQLRMMAQQLRKQQLDVDFFVASEDRLSDAVRLTTHLYQQEGILPGRLGVGKDTAMTDPSLVKIVLTRPIAGEPDGSKAKTR